MSYVYQTQRPFVFTEEGQVMFLRIRDRAKSLLKLSGAIRTEELIAECIGCTWNMRACVDRLVELGELQRLPQDNIPGQYEVFIAGPSA